MYSFIVGIDISKLTLDAVMIINGNKETATHHHLSNTPEQIQKLFKGFSQLPNFSLDKCLICIEASGVYTYPILSFVTQNESENNFIKCTRYHRYKTFHCKFLLIDL